jgi:hypothetical protein
MFNALILSMMIDLLHPKFQSRGYLKEPLVQAETRYASIADDIAAVVSDPDEEPLFDGDAGREATGLMLAAIAWHESAFRRDVDICKGAHSRGDHGRSIGLLQLMSGPNYEGHSAKDICADRKLAIRLGLHVLRRAKSTCAGSPRRWLQSYAAGGCGIRSNVSRDVCRAYERVGQKYLDGVSCASVGPVTLRSASAT